MEQQIQYAKTEDGVSIAYWTIGEGEPLMYTPQSMWGHIQLEWEWPEWRAWYEAIASKRMLIRFDGRGTGLSDRDVSYSTQDTAILDMEAVLDRLGVQAVHLLGNYSWAGAAVRYAAAHAAKVSSLILWCPLANPSDIAPGLWGLTDIGKTDWQTYTELVGQLLLDYSSGDQAKRAAKFIRESIHSETYNMGIESFRNSDTSSFLSQVAAPTLVLHRDETVTTLTSARDIASGVPNARLAIFKGKALWPFFGDSEPVLQAIDEFLSECEEASRSAAPAGLTGGFATILFTDMESSTALSQRLGDAGAQEVRRAHNTIVRDALQANSGNEIKHTGDGIMASFLDRIVDA